MREGGRRNCRLHRARQSGRQEVSVKVSPEGTSTSSCGCLTVPTRGEMEAGAENNFFYSIVASLRKVSRGRTECCSNSAHPAQAAPAAVFQVLNRELFRL